MNDFTAMHVFFIVTTAAVVLIGVLIALILMRILRILRHAERITEMAAHESALIREDVAEFRLRVKASGFRFTDAVRLAVKSIERMAKRIMGFKK